MVLLNCNVSLCVKLIYDFVCLSFHCGMRIMEASPDDDDDARNSYAKVKVDLQS